MVTADRLETNHTFRLTLKPNRSISWKGNMLFLLLISTPILIKTNKSVVIQVTALRAEIDKLALDLKSLGLISTSRTGAVAMTKGSRIFN